MGRGMRVSVLINGITGEVGLTSYSGFARMFFSHGLRVLVLSQGSKLRMPEMIRVGPFQEFNPGHEFRPDPNTFIHIFGGQSFAPTRTMFLRKMTKGQSGTSKDRNRRQRFGQRATARLSDTLFNPSLCSRPFAETATRVLRILIHSSGIRMTLELS